MIEYIDSVEEIEASMLEGFFDGWANPPSKVVHLEVLRKCYARILAVESDSKRIVGFINAISDGISEAYLPWLEVLPEYRNQGIGIELINRMLEKLKHLYGINLMCEQELQSFYYRLGMRPGIGMSIRNLDKGVWEQNR